MFCDKLSKNLLNDIAVLATILISVTGLVLGTTERSPPVTATSAVSLLLGLIYLAERFKGLRINTLIPMCQTVSMAVSIILMYTFTGGCYPGFITGVIPYPVLGGAAIACLIGYFGLRFYRVLIMVFTVFFSCAISNFTCVVIYMFYESEFDVTVTNALNTQELAAGLVWSIVCAFLFWAYSKTVTRETFYDEKLVLEAEA